MTFFDVLTVSVSTLLLYLIYLQYQLILIKKAAKKKVLFEDLKNAEIFNETLTYQSVQSSCQSTDQKQITQIDTTSLSFPTAFEVPAMSSSSDATGTMTIDESGTKTNTWTTEDSVIIANSSVSTSQNADQSSASSDAKIEPVPLTGSKKNQIIRKRKSLGSSKKRPPSKGRLPKLKRNQKKQVADGSGNGSGSGMKPPRNPKIEAAAPQPKISVAAK